MRVMTPATTTPGSWRVYTTRGKTVRWRVILGNVIVIEGWADGIHQDAPPGGR